MASAMDEAIRQAGLPPRYREFRRSGWNGKWPVPKWDKERWSMTFFGLPGTGKTHLAVVTLLLLSLDFPKDIFTTDAEGNEELFQTLYPGRFVSCRGWMERLRDSISEGGMAQVRRRVEEAKILLIDDVPGQEATPFEASKFDNLIGRRYEMQLPTIVTTNAPDLAQIAETYGDRISSRLAEGVLIRRDGRDWRMG